jgi:outer membrane protein TolC
MKRLRTKLHLRLLLAAFVVAASGCQVDQKAEVAKYRHILDQHVPEVGPPHDGEVLTLRRAMALANKADENLASRGEVYVQALINRNRALANFLPTVSFQPSFIVAQPATGKAAGLTGNGNIAYPGPVNSGFGQTIVNPLPGSPTIAAEPNAGSGVFTKNGGVLTRLEAPVVGNINLFRGFGDLANVEVAKWNIKQQRELMLDLQATLLLNVAQGYYQVLRSEAQLRVLRNSLFVQETRVKLVHDQFNRKLATRLTVVQTEAQADATRAQLVQAEGDVQNGRATLAFLIGVREVAGPLADDFSPPPKQDKQVYLDEARRSRRDLMAVQYNVQAARRAVDVYVAQYYPSVSLNVAGFLYREFFSDASKWDAILAVNLPIFSAGLIEADVRDAWSRLRQAALARENLVRSVIHDVELAYQNLITTERRIRELEGEVAAADEALHQAQSAYDNGLAINLDVLTAQDQLLSAQLQLTGARYDRIIYYLDLRRVSGQLDANPGG